MSNNKVEDLKITMSELEIKISELDVIKEEARQLQIKMLPEFFDKIMNGIDYCIKGKLKYIHCSCEERFLGEFHFTDNKEDVGRDTDDYGRNIYPKLSILLPVPEIHRPGRINPEYKSLWKPFFEKYEFIKAEDVKILFEEQFKIRYGMEGYEVQPVQ